MLDTSLLQEGTRCHIDEFRKRLAFWFGDLLEAFGYKFFGLAKYTNVSFSVRYSLKMYSGVIFMYALYICTYWLTYSYVGLLF